VTDLSESECLRETSVACTNKYCNYSPNIVGIGIIIIIVVVVAVVTAATIINGFFYVTFKI
jgi:hypothetical protein